MIKHVIVSCEHARCQVPARYRSAFRGASKVLRSHRGSDLGALELARSLSRRLRVQLFAAPATRLLADPNRSLGHRELFSEWSRRLPKAEREAVLDRYWRPHREAIERAIRSHMTRRRTVLHLSVHTFTPRWRGIARDVDVALLYDPARKRERAFADAWLEALGTLRPDLRLRRNHPYRGNADGLTTHFRRCFDTNGYLGVELEVSQRYPLGPPAPWRRLWWELGTSLRGVVAMP